MRIVGGRFRGTALTGLGKGDPARHLRPTTDRLRETLFNLLAHSGYGDPVPGARVLDVFAGTGALGLEALSRGAAHVSFVENGTKSARLIQDNIARLGVGAETRLIRRDARKLAKADTACDLILLDPPYGKGLAAPSLHHLQQMGWIAENALIVLEEGETLPGIAGFTLLDHRQYGDSHLHFLTSGEERL